MKSKSTLLLAAAFILLMSAAVFAQSNAAPGKIVLDYPAGRFVDYMTLFKINGEWKIVNKSFYFEPNSFNLKNAVIDNQSDKFSA